jgi:hypothetical protein
LDHPFENLGPERFQQLCQALFVKEFPGVVCLPVGQPDGGRDAIQRISTGDGEEFIVFQVKFSRSVQAEVSEREWVMAAARGEAAKVRRLKEKGACKYVFVTNVRGTAHLEVGSIDRLQVELAQAVGIPVQCWWRDDISRRIDSAWDLKLRYPELLTGQDFLRLLVTHADPERHERRWNAISNFIGEQYRLDQDVKFKQVELQNKLLDLFVDLPFHLSLHESARPAPATLLLSGLMSRTFIDGPWAGGSDDASFDEDREFGTASLLLRDEAIDWLPQLVVEGAPGQGKSTLAQYVCQVHRIRLLNKQVDLERLPANHRTAPVLLPFRVDLRDLSEWFAGKDPFAVSATTDSKVADRNLETFLARLVRFSAGGIDFDAQDLYQVAKVAPLLLALDGLDEVADIGQRTDVVSGVTRSIARLRDSCKRLQVLITSRPAAFPLSPGFDQAQFPRLQLGSVKRGQILQYANKWMTARGLQAYERQEFEAILNEKLSLPHLRDLSRNPMQLTILLSLVHTLGPALPDKRTALYDAYVDLFFGRESTKNPVVRQHLDLLKDIHRYLGWLLHSSAELRQGEATSGRLTSDGLRTVLFEYLTKEEQSTEIVDQVFNAMLERVVMIVSRIEGTHEFEVQPLREYFAARYLYDTASYSPTGKERAGSKPDRFDAIARNHYWLNVTRFFCGCFSKGELLDLADRVKQLTDDPVQARTKYPSTLAAWLLSDWVFSQSQAAIRSLATSLDSASAIRKLAPALGRYQLSDVIRIPEACGGRGVWLRAMSLLLERELKWDVAHRLAVFVRFNASIAETTSIWLEKLADQDGSSFNRWLGIGGDLGCLRDLPKEKVRGLLAGRGPSIETTRILWASDHEDCIVNSAGDLELLREEFRSSFPYRRGRKEIKPPFYLTLEVLAELSSPILGVSIAGDTSHQLHDSLLAFAKADSQASLRVACPGDFADCCYEVTRLIAGRQAASDLPFSSGILWEQAIEDCRSSLGEILPVVNAAINVVGQAGQRGRRVAPFDLYDRNVPLCDRLRYARSQTKEAAWWQGTFIDAKDDFDRALCNLIYWKWAPLRVVQNTESVASQSLESFGQRDWEVFLRFACRRHWDPDLESAQKPKRGANPYTGTSKRFALMLANKDPATFGLPIFKSHFIDSSESEIACVQFRQASAQIAAGKGELDWSTALRIVRDTYRQGAAFAIQTNSRLPVHVVDKILAEPDDYPAELWDRAEGQAAALARKSMQPIAKIATKERWFDH